MRRTSLRGFTMVELMVVLVIIGLLSGLAIPRFLRSDAESRLEGDAQRVLLDFRSAKQAANKTGLRHWIRITPPNRVEVWRAKYDTIYSFTTDTNYAVRMFVDELNAKTKFGFSSDDLKNVTQGPWGFESPSSVGSTTLGLGQSDSTTAEDCIDGAKYPAASASTKGWDRTEIGGSYILNACGSSIADMTEGVAYLTSTGSDQKMYAIGYDRFRVQLRLFAYNKSANSWEER